jgi:Calponin homology (CH) domain
VLLCVVVCFVRPPSQIYEGYLPGICSMLWALFRQSSIPHDMPMSEHLDSLLRWCSLYARQLIPGVCYNNFNDSFSDGMALNALLYALKPGCVELAQIPKILSTEALYQTACVTAKEVFGVPHVLDASLMAQGLDELSIIVFLTMLRSRAEALRKNKQCSLYWSLNRKRSVEKKYLLRLYFEGFDELR